MTYVKVSVYPEQVKYIIIIIFIYSNKFNLYIF